MVLCDGEQVRYATSFRLFVQRVSSRNEAGNNSDALKDVDPMFGCELSYPIAGNYTAAVSRRERL